MNLAFLLHIYQPPTQDPKILKEIANKSYYPLIKAIKSTRDASFTLNIPLSLNEHLDKNQMHDLIKSFKDMYEEGKLELTSTGAYHPLLPRIPEKIQEEQILLNEYGLGYYYGKDKGFEGEDALMIKNINGFFPPEMAVDTNLVKLLNDLGYSWALVDEVAINEEEYDPNTSVYKYAGTNFNLVVRDTEISNLLSFKRDSNVEDLIEMIISRRQNNKDVVIALDGEFFGHHYEEGIFMFESLVERLQELEVNIVSVSKLVEDAEYKEIFNVQECTWGATREDIKKGNLYPLWESKDNELQAILWDVYDRYIMSYEPTAFAFDTSQGDADLETVPIWDSQKLPSSLNEHVSNVILMHVDFLRGMASDLFWWASKKDVGGVTMYDGEFILKILDNYIEYAKKSNDHELLKFLNLRAEEIKKIL